MIIEEGLLNTAAVHFFQAQGLGAELDGIGIVFLRSAVFVFHRPDDIAAAGAVFDGIGSTTDAETTADEIAAACRVDAAPGIPRSGINAFVLHPSEGG